VGAEGVLGAVEEGLDARGVPVGVAGLVLEGLDETAMESFFLKGKSLRKKSRSRGRESERRGKRKSRAERLSLSFK
jgi:hypothetical protein